MGIERFDTLRVVGTTTEAATIGRANNQWARPIAAGAITNFRRLPKNMIGGSMDEIGKLNLRHWPQPFHGQANGNTGNGEFSHRRIHHTLGAVAFQQTFGRAENTTKCADIFAQHEDARIASHLLGQRSANGFNDCHLWHYSTSSA